VSFNPPPAAKDLVSGHVPVSCNHASGDTFALGTTKVTCTAQDDAHNTATASFNVTVQDTTPPAVTVPNAVAAEATGPAGALVNFGASAFDLVDLSVGVTCVPPSGSIFPLGSTEVVCSAVDAHNNRSSASFKVEVRDTTAPTLPPLPGIVEEATGSAGAKVSWLPLFANDAVDGDQVPVLCNPVSGSVFGFGDTTVLCSATDAHGNTSGGAFTVTVRDTKPPTVTVPADITAIATAATGAFATFSSSAIDVVDGAVPTQCSPSSGSVFAPGVTLVTCTATDSHRNSASASFTITVTFSWSGLLQPINVDGSSVFKLGRTVPVKFSLTELSASITNALAKLTIAKVTNSVAGSVIEADSTSAADIGNQFRYDPSAGQYIYNLATSGLSQGTWQLRVDLGDGVVHTTLISFRK
jgi:hypothetical protein